ncbi:MAG TPA: DUF58 domain-containing protein [Chloroflexi bacterium]|mgnify:CR=1 FL=1|nr:DUF58 domain-containing protein [Chloroflexota bacterium]
MITPRKTFISVFLFLLITSLALAVVVPYVLPPGTGAEAFYRSVPFRVVLLLSGLLVIAWLWALFSMRGLDLERTARVTRHQMGHIFEERFVVINNSRLGKLWVEVIDQSPIPGKQGSRVVSNLGGKQTRSYVSRTLLTRRGAFQLGPTIVRSGDPFGLFLQTQEFGTETTLLVLPMVYELERFASPLGLLPGGRAQHQRTAEATPYAAGVREYVPGDPLNRIHWRTTARKDKLMVKEFEQDPMADVWIFLDAYEAANIGQELEGVDIKERDPFWVWTQTPEVRLPKNTFEYGVTIAASIASYYLRRGRNVGLVSAGRGLTLLQAERGDRQQVKILETLAFIRSEGRLPLSGVVDAQASHIPRGSTAVLITASTQSTVDVAIEQLLRRDIRPILVLIDPRSFGGRASNREMYERIKGYSIPACHVSYGDNVQEVLETCY